MSEIQSQEQLIEVFDAFLSGNNEKIKVATQYLRNFIKKLESLVQLLQVLQSSQNASHRQLAAVLLKRKISSLYVEMSPEDRQYLKSVLLDRYFIEQNSNTKKSIGIAIGDIARIALPQGEWNELLQVIGQKTSTTQDDTSKESGLRLLSLIIDVAGENLEKHYSELHIFFKGILLEQQNTNNINVKVEAYKCVLYMLETIYEDIHIQLYSDLIEPVLSILLELIKHQIHEDSIFLGFDLIMNIVEGSSTLLDKYLPDFIQYILSEQFLLNKQLDINIKECGIDLLGVICEFRKSLLTKNPEILQKFIEVIFTLIVESNATTEKGEEGLQEVALYLIEDIAIYLPKRKIYTYLLQNIKILFTQQNEKHLVIGFNVLAKISEGCAEQLKKDLKNPIIHPFLIDGLNHPHSSSVKAAAIITVAYFSQFLIPDIYSFHHVIIPSLSTNLHNISVIDPDLIQKTLYCIDMFVENLEQSVVQYLPILIPQLLNVLETNTTTLPMKRLAISALGSCIQSSGEDILPYAEDLYKRFSILLNNNDQNIIYLKAQAIGEMGKLISALKERKDIIHQLFVPCVPTVYQNLLQTDDWELREGCFTFFYNLAFSTGQEFSAVLEQYKLIQIALDRTTASEGLQKGKKQETQDLGIESESDEDIHQGDNIEYKTSFLDEKASAIRALGEFADACPLTFAPFFEQTVAALDQVHQYFYDNVRSLAAVCYFNLVKSLAKLNNGGTIPTYKRGLPCTQRLNSQVEEFIKIEVLTKFIYHIKEDETPDVVGNTMQALKDIIDTLGPVAVDTALDEIVEAILLLLKGETYCQATASDEEDQESNYTILEHLSDLIITLAKVLHDGFAPSFQQIIPELLRYLTPKRDQEEISIASGIFAEVFKYSPSTTLLCGKNILEFSLATQDIDNDELKRNICYLLGNLTKNGKDSVFPFYSQILQYLKFVIQNSTLQEAKDNAVAAACKLAYTAPNLVPVPELLSVVLTFAPLKGDLEENYTIAEFIIFLFNNNAQLLKPHLENVLALLIDTIVNQKKYKTEQEIYANITQFVKNIANADKECHDTIQTLLGKLNENEKSILAQALN